MVVPQKSKNRIIVLFSNPTSDHIIYSKELKAGPQIFITPCS